MVDLFSAVAKISSPSCSMVLLAASADVESDVALVVEIDAGMTSSFSGSFRSRRISFESSSGVTSSSPECPIDVPVKGAIT